MGERGLKGYAVFPIEVCPYDPSTCSNTVMLICQTGSPGVIDPDLAGRNVH